MAKSNYYGYVAYECYMILAELKNGKTEFVLEASIGDKKCLK